MIIAVPRDPMDETKRCRCLANDLTECLTAELNVVLDVSIDFNVFLRKLTHKNISKKGYEYVFLF